MVVDGLRRDVQVAPARRSSARARRAARRRAAGSVSPTGSRACWPGAAPVVGYQAAGPQDLAARPASLRPGGPSRSSTARTARPASEPCDSGRGCLGTARRFRPGRRRAVMAARPAPAGTALPHPAMERLPRAGPASDRASQTSRSPTAHCTPGQVSRRRPAWRWPRRVERRLGRVSHDLSASADSTGRCGQGLVEPLRDAPGDIEVFGGGPPRRASPSAAPPALRTRTATSSPAACR